MVRQCVCIGLGVVLGVSGYAVAQHATGGGGPAEMKRKILLEQVLKEKVDGKEAKITVLELESPPGHASPPHRHPGPVVAYVLEGELESKVGDGPLKVYRKGELFYEPARGLHAVSRNPSKTHATRFLVFFLTASDEKHLVLPK